MAPNFFLFVFIFLYIYAMLFHICHARRSKKNLSDEASFDLTKDLTNSDLEEVLGTLSLNDLHELKHFMDTSFIINEDIDDMENSEDDGIQRRMGSYHADNNNNENGSPVNTKYAIDENVIKYKRAVLAAQVSWRNKRKARDAMAKLKTQNKFRQANPNNCRNSLRNKRQNGHDEVNAQGQVLSEAYLKQLELSFSQGQNSDDNAVVGPDNEHLRVKRNF